MLSGVCDFIIVSRDDTFNLQKDFALNIIEESILYTPLYCQKDGISPLGLQQKMG